MMNKKRVIFLTASYIALFLWMLFIFIMSAQTGEVSGDTSGSFIETLCEALITDFSELNEKEKADIIALFSLPVRKAAHFTEYFILACLFNLAVIQSKEKTVLSKKGLFVSFACAVLYAVTDEIHQRFVPGRVGNIIDVLIDSAGVLCGCIAFAVAYRMIEKKRKSKAPAI